MPLYENLSQEEWERKIDFFKNHYSPCVLCPRQCGAERENREPGICGAGRDVKIASANLHFGEEPPVSGSRGSGTVFFSGCSLRCIFCQNYPISHLNNGEVYSIDRLAGAFLVLQKKGAHNINLVSPTPYLYHFARALFLAVGKGLRIPVVYNSGGYERPEIVKYLRRLVDVFMPDFKYYGSRVSQRFSRARNYRRYAVPSIREMYDQTGKLVLDEEGMAEKGVIIRHLILPGGGDDSRKVLSAIAGSRFKNSHLSLMSQYFPAYRAAGTAAGRRITADEYREVKEYALSLGFTDGWFQEL